MWAYDQRFRADTLCADVRKQRMILKRLREERLTLPENAPPHLRALLEERIDKVALDLAKTANEAQEALKVLPTPAQRVKGSLRLV